MKSVPLVMYKDGVRTVIGSANVSEEEAGLAVSGSFEGGPGLIVDAKIDPEFNELINPALAGGFSIGVTPPDVKAIFNLVPPYVGDSSKS